MNLIGWHALKIISLGFITFVLSDLFWVGFLMRDFYSKYLGTQLRENGVYWSPVFTVWFLLVVGLYVFVLPKATTLFAACLYGALYGIIVYGIYNVTNYAILANWPVIVVVVDMLWGAVINGIVAMILFLL